MSDNKRTIEISWHIDDVKQQRPDLNDQQALQVLLEMEHNHDANFGITWETIDVVAEDLYPEQNPLLMATEDDDNE